MNYRNVTDTFIKVAKVYQQDMREAINYLRAQKVYARMANKEPKIDARDFVPMVALMGIQGNTPQERAEDIHKKLDAMTAAFEDPNPSGREYYLNLLYNLVDTFDPDKVDMHDEKQVGTLLQSLLIDQTVATKRIENPEYFSKRYPTPQARTLMDARDHFRMAVGSTIKTHLVENKINIEIELSLPFAFPKHVQEIQYLREEFEKSLRDQAVEKNGNVPKSTTVDFPILDTMVPMVGKDIADLPHHSSPESDLMLNYFLFMVQNSQLQDGSKNSQGLKQAGIEDLTEALYIDGKPFAEFEKEHFPNAANRDELHYPLLTNCMLSGKHKLDVVYAYRNEKGEMQYEAKLLRAAITPQQEQQYLQQFSWLRRLFNWGPFRIESLQEKMDRIVDTQETEERHAGIIADQRERIVAGIKIIEENERQRKLSLEQNERRRTAYAQEKERLADSVANWDKDSVIGILGQQITASYTVNNAEVNGICDTIRKEIASTNPPDIYDKISPLFAKLVLYSQLCSEREANNGQPGETEQMLRAGKSIKENIQDAAAAMAKNPVFRNLVLEKMGTTINTIICPGIALFETLMGSGGCDRFRVEFIQKLQNMPQQKTQQAATVTKEIENQKKTETLLK